MTMQKTIYRSFTALMHFPYILVTFEQNITYVQVAKCNLFLINI